MGAYNIPDWRKGAQAPQRLDPAALREPQAPSFRLSPRTNWGVGQLYAEATPARPVCAIALGPNDQSGGVYVEGSGIEGKVAIGPGAPYRGSVTGTIVVTPLHAAGTTIAHTLDLVFYYEMPAEFPKRAPLVDAQAITAATKLTRNYATFGRARARVAIAAPSAALDVKVKALFVTPSGTLSFDAVAALATTTGHVYEFSAQTKIPTSSGDAGVTVPDFVQIEFTGTGPTCEFAFRAED